MKQKLVDVNKLHYHRELIDKLDHGISSAIVVYAKEIDKAPIINAIPIEWIKKWIKAEPLGVDSLIAPEYTIEAMLYWWEKENE